MMTTIHWRWSHLEDGACRGGQIARGLVRSPWGSTDWTPACRGQQGGKGGLAGDRSVITGQLIHPCFEIFPLEDPNRRPPGVGPKRQQGVLERDDFLMARDSKHTSFQRNDTEDVEIELASEAGPVDGRPRYSLGGHYTQVGRA